MFNEIGAIDMEIKREAYLQQLISYRFDGLVKVITGIRRCGKSYLLKKIYKDYLLQNGVKDEQIKSRWFLMAENALPLEERGV